MITSRGLLVGAAVLLTLSGCAGQTSETAAPTAPSAPSETPTPTPVAGPAAKVVIGAEAVTVQDAAGLDVGSSPYAGGGEAIVDLLTDALGEPTVSDDGGCSDATSYLWPDYEGLNVSVSPGTPTPPFTGVLVTTKAASAGDIAIESGAGLAVGDDVSAFLATLPAEQNFMDENNSFVWEATATAKDTPFGGVIYTTDGAVSAILAPGTIFSGYC